MDSPFINVELISAVSENGAIGKNGKLPWLYPADLLFFKKKTLHHAVLMGRKTFESIGSRPLPNRTNVVVSGSLDAQSAPVMVSPSLEQALDSVRWHNTVCIAGGHDLYKAALSLASTVWLTRIPVTIEGATAFFPKLGPEFVLEQSFAIGKAQTGSLIMVPHEELAQTAQAHQLKESDFLKVDKFVVPARLTKSLNAPVWIES